MSNFQTVTIEKIIPGGSGLGRMADGLVVMVPRVLPAEKVTFKIISKKKGYLVTDLVDVLEPSPLRIEPLCLYYGMCGGCDFQHISYGGQLEIKQDILRHQLSRGLDDESLWLQFLVDMLSAPNPFYYRQRIRLQSDGRGNIGFFRPGSNDIVPIERCLLAHQKINSVIEGLRQSNDAGNLLKNSEAIELMHDQNDDTVAVFFHFSRKPRAMDISSAKNCALKISDIKSLFFKTKSWGDLGPYLPEINDGGVPEASSDVHFSIHLADGKKTEMVFEAGGFCQVNREQNDNLVQTLLDWACVTKDMTILDLFCGLGNFSIPAALYGKELLGMDLQRSSIRSAQRNAERNGLDNCFFEQKNSLDAAKNLVDSGRSFDLVILDPPRQGCKEIVPFLSKIASSEIIYISCDPATLSRDLSLLLSSGFRIEKIQGVDMFPQTHHIETIVLLRRV